MDINELKFLLHFGCFAEFHCFFGIQTILYDKGKESRQLNEKECYHIILTKKCLWKEFDENKFFSNRLISQHDVIIH